MKKELNLDADVLKNQLPLDLAEVAPRIAPDLTPLFSLLSKCSKHHTNCEVFEWCGTKASVQTFNDSITMIRQTREEFYEDKVKNLTRHIARKLREQLVGIEQSLYFNIADYEKNRRQDNPSRSPYLSGLGVGSEGKGFIKNIITTDELEDKYWQKIFESGGCEKIALCSKYWYNKLCGPDEGKGPCYMVKTSWGDLRICRAPLLDNDFAPDRMVILTFQKGNIALRPLKDCDTQLWGGDLVPRPAIMLHLGGPFLADFTINTIIGLQVDNSLGYFIVKRT